MVKPKTNNQKTIKIKVCLVCYKRATPIIVSQTTATKFPFCGLCSKFIKNKIQVRYITVLMETKPFDECIIENENMFGIESHTITFYNVIKEVRYQ